MNATSLKSAIVTNPTATSLSTQSIAKSRQGAASTLARTRISPAKQALKRQLISREEALRQAILRTG